MKFLSSLCIQLACCVTSSSSNRVTNLQINIPADENVVIDFETSFPDLFSVSYEKRDNLFNVTFVRINASDPAYPVPKSNVYVIDKKTGNPVMHRLQSNKEVRFCFVLCSKPKILAKSKIISNTLNEDVYL